MLASTRLFPLETAPAEAANGFCRTLEASTVSFDGLWVGLPYSLETLPDLARVAAGHRWRVVGIDGPLPERLARKVEGKRQPYLAAPDDPEERLAAVKICLKNLDALASLGGTCLALELGRLPLLLEESDLHKSYERGELFDEFEPIALRFRKVQEDRKSVAARWRDGARFSLDRLVRQAEAKGITLALRIGGSLWQYPSPREAALICADMTGSSTRIAFDSGAWWRLQMLGLTAGNDRRTQLLGLSALALVHDGCGLNGDLAAGLGDAPFDWLAEAPLSANVVLDGQSDTTPTEIASAARLIESGLKRRSEPESVSE
ncbi:MAG: hypothetical protein SGI86_21760 [Deltaproteobacteria bacterium]|nr:hypothetical protein [Deltaproteobacteria bacterium]